MSDSVQEYIDEVKKCLDEVDGDKIGEIVSSILDAYRGNRRIFTLGNGGSASTASHFACDLTKSAVIERKRRLHIISLTDNVALITAISNDYGYDSIFKEQLANLLSEGDIVIAISASGNSPNVLEAVEYAKSIGAETIAICGFGGGRLAHIADRAIVFSAKDYGQIEDTHLVMAHLISEEVRRKLKNEE